MFQNSLFNVIEISASIDLIKNNHAPPTSQPAHLSSVIPMVHPGPGALDVCKVEWVPWYVKEAMFMDYGKTRPGQPLLSTGSTQCMNSARFREICAFRSDIDLC